MAVGMSQERLEFLGGKVEGFRRDARTLKRGFR